MTCAGYNYGFANVQSQEEIDFLAMKQQLKSGTSCLTGDLYNSIRSSSQSMKYYCDFVCSIYKKYKQPNYISTKYGQRGEKLGEGSFGIVYKYLSSNGTEYAIKIPKSFKYKELFEELNASQCIKEKMSPYFLEKMGIIRECVTPTGGSPHLVMYYYAQTLEDKMKSVYKYDSISYNLEQKKQLYTDMLYLAGELRALHKIGLAHRDLKPENAMIDKEGIPILVDFGLTTPNLLNAKTVCGTPLFIDPEITTYKTTGGATADVYALGIIYYIMMTGDSGWDKVQTMLLSGGYGTMLFNPNFSTLGLTGEKAFIMNMLISSKKTYGKDYRWDIEKVYQYMKQAFQQLNEPPKQVESRPQSYEPVSQKIYSQPQTSYQPRQINNNAQVQVDQTNQVIRNAQIAMNQQMPVKRKVHAPQVINKNANLIPYYQPVHHGAGENLNNYGNYLNRNQVQQQVQKIQVMEPRVVRVIRHPVKVIYVN